MVVKERGDGSQEFRLIVFHRHHEVTALFGNLGHNMFLTPHGINGHQRVGQVDLL
jgi:hypothetical protein